MGTLSPQNWYTFPVKERFPALSVTNRSKLACRFGATHCRFSDTKCRFNVAEVSIGCTSGYFHGTTPGRAKPLGTAKIATPEKRRWHRSPLCSFKKLGPGTSFLTVRGSRCIFSFDHNSATIVSGTCLKNAGLSKTYRHAFFFKNPNLAVTR